MQYESIQGSLRSRQFNPDGSRTWSVVVASENLSIISFIYAQRCLTQDSHINPQQLEAHKYFLLIYYLVYLCPTFLLTTGSPQGSLHQYNLYTTIRPY